MTPSVKRGLEETAARERAQVRWDQAVGRYREKLREESYIAEHLSDEAREEIEWQRRNQ